MNEKFLAGSGIKVVSGKIRIGDLPRAVELAIKHAKPRPTADNQKDGKMTLSDSLKKEIVKELYQIRLDGMFGDGLERDYIMDGVTIVGLNDMTDDALVEEYRESVDNDEEDALIIKLNALT